MNLLLEPDTTPMDTSEDLGAGWDLWLLGAAVALAGFGVVMVLSASGHFALSVYNNAWHFGIRQLVGLGLGAAGAAVVVTVPWVMFRRASPYVWFGTLVAVFLVHLPVIGHAAKGAPRWIDLGPINLQPSEFAKIGLAMVLADVLARNEGHMKDVVGVVGAPMMLFVFPMLVGVFLQSDLGTIALMMGITGVAFFVAGLEWRWVFAAIGLAAVGVTLLIVMEPYRAARVVSFLDPLETPQGDGYQVVQGWVALAVGGITGSGLGQGVAQQGFLPEAHTDMISAVITEELGVFGWLLVFCLHGIVLWRGMHIAANARSLFDMILASALSAVLAAQVAINTGVVCGLVPPKGLVLPFLSYGASAAIAHTLIVAILLRIGLETHRAAGGR